jgi:hypothetical protein
VQTKFYWSLDGGPVFIMRTASLPALINIQLTLYNILYYIKTKLKNLTGTSKFKFSFRGLCLFLNPYFVIIVNCVLYMFSQNKILLKPSAEDCKPTSTYKHPTHCVGLVQNRYSIIIIISSKSNLFSPQYGCKIAHLMLNKKHSLEKGKVI